MIFLILNALICAALIGTSFTLDSKKSKMQETSPLVNLILFLASLFGLMALTLVLCFFAPIQLAITLGKITYILMAWFCVNCCFYLLYFPQFKRGTASKVVQWVLNIAALVVIFFVKMSVTNIAVTYNTFQVTSGLVFSGSLGRSLMLTWFQAFQYFYCIILPAFFMVMVLVRSENTKSQVDAQRMRIGIIGIIASFAVFAFVNYASVYQTMIRSLVMVCFIPELCAFVIAERNDEIWDGKIILRGLAKFAMKYFVPAILIGLFFTLSWPLFSRNKILFVVLFAIQTFIILTLCRLAEQFLNKRGFMRDSRYATDFSNDLAAISFEKEPKLIAQDLYEIFHKYLDSSHVKILIDSTDGYFETVYSSDGSDEKKQLTINTECFDKLLNLHQQVIFTEFVQNDYSVSSIKEPLLDLLRQTDSDAFIVLSEGRHLVGLIALGKKENGNVYNEYDYSVFNNVYSNFFVIGYFMKNMMNESVVGTVDREIRMSGQIITSIQENMDQIKNPKVDAGYLMVPAHNIGGEFVDMIRLTKDRHIFIIGALSGKGIAASMSMVIMKSITRTFLAETGDFKVLVEKVNTFIRESLPKGTFFAGTFGLLDFSTDTLYYINCSSAALFLYTRAYNNVIEIQGEGHVLGFAKDISTLIKVKKVKLAPGDILFSCTDGLIDTRSMRGEQFGRGRIQNEIMENASYPATKMAQFTYDSLKHFTSTELEDDVTIFLLKYLLPEASGGEQK